MTLTTTECTVQIAKAQVAAQHVAYEACFIAMCIVLGLLLWDKIKRERVAYLRWRRRRKWPPK